MATGTRKSFGRDLSDMFNYSDAVRKALNDSAIILPRLVSAGPALRGVKRGLALSIDMLAPPN